MALHALLVLEVPSVKGEKKVSFLWELQDRGWNYTAGATSLTKTFVADLDEANVLEPKPEKWFDELDYDDYLSGCYGFGTSIDDVETSARADIEQAANKIGITEWSAGLHIGPREVASLRSSDDPP